jgi:hypothetical protein
VNQLPEDGQRSRFGVTVRQVDRVADAEAHTQMICPNDVHGYFTA